MTDHTTTPTQATTHERTTTQAHASARDARHVGALDSNSISHVTVGAGGK